MKRPRTIEINPFQLAILLNEDQKQSFERIWGRQRILRQNDGFQKIFKKLNSFNNHHPIMAASD